MPNELTNLVPRSKARAFRQQYFIHLATVTVVMLALLMAMQCLLLIPSYLYERQIVDATSAQLSKLTASLSTTQDQEVQTRIAALQAKASFLGTLATVPTASTALRAVLAVPHSGITLNGFIFTPPKVGVPGSMQISGTAATRETLRGYDTALTGLPFVKSADLPISVYAKANKIPFSINLTMNPLDTATP
jgi:hypothetical protein